MTNDQAILKKANSWMTSTFDADTTAKVNHLITNNPTELEDSFYKNLEFGTGGMRGIMGVGTNRINKYTLGKNTQGLSNFMKQQFNSEQLKVVIAYDCRHNSKSLAKTVADVFTANGIDVFLFSDLRTTPELSFSVKYLNCHCGIVLTASHNPPEYNGYKVYWQGGGQLVPPQDAAIINEIDSLKYEDILFKGQDERITYIDSTIDEAFFAASVDNGSFNTPNSAKENLNIVFTSLHGTSITAIPQVLERAGYNNVNIVKEQAEPNGDFPTVKSPNPEEPEALKMATDLALAINADIVIGTDPDSDRLGIAVRDRKDQMVLLNGNQTMVVMTWFLLEQWKKSGKLHNDTFVGSTIVSTPMLKVMTEAYGAQYHEGLTGFKWIAKMIKDLPDLDFIGGGEESFGFMVGDFVRDKDAVTSTLLACEIAAQLKAEGSSILDKLHDLYSEFGYYKEELISLVKKGKDGAEEIKQMLIELRNNPLQTIAGETVVKVEDYANSTSLNPVSQKTTELNIPKSNVLIYYTDKGTKIAARPSGTEPKIKFYISVNSTLSSKETIDETTAVLNSKIASIKSQLGLS
ncbi:phospho-sugar mutase [Croceibacter atlanticus]|jgi:phosphoglucomutase|uniref:phospho-sugar mutase n=1 Tax=Croceibacter atlanticus TaxID=313588 RepID=UPI0030DD8A87|tara:strand:- start:72303 stop:74030 length:1728 start_codon:yes stop_codon:yes gene_type:complete